MTGLGSDELAELARQNFADTYFRLALSIKGTGEWIEEGFSACLGDLRHPLANFALKLRLDPWVAARIAQLANSRSPFHVYSLPGDLPEYRDEILARAGFTLGTRMIMMVADPTDIEERLPATTGQWLSPADEAPRRIAARLMTDQFFSRHPISLRNAITEAIVAAPLPLLSESINRKLVAAAMVSETPQMLGVYNLCVGSAHRSKGIGRKLMAEVARRGKIEQRWLTLQCDAQLAGWYQQMGFRAVGNVDVFVLSRERLNDIMSDI